MGKLPADGAEQPDFEFLQQTFTTVKQTKRLRLDPTTPNTIPEKKFDIIVVGAGILGTMIAFWLVDLYDCSVLLVDREDAPAFHTSSRNTGIIHRPFYLDPAKKKFIARASQKSYSMWSALAERFQLPWSQTGTIEVAIADGDIDALERYVRWGIENGMQEDELRLLDPSQVKQLEPLVECPGALFSRTDTSVDYGRFTSKVFELGMNNGLQSLLGSRVISIAESAERVEIGLEDGDGMRTTIGCKLLVNAAGGAAVDLAHMLDLGRQYTDLHFRGEYWVVDRAFAQGISRNIYSVARHREFPFLDPHFIVRADGRREIGPNAVLVSGPYVYRGLSNRDAPFLRKVFEGPNLPKAKLFINTSFLALVWDEWRSSLSKKAMCGRVRRFIPSLDSSMLVERGSAGVRSSVIDRDGFVAEALQLRGSKSFHILNYNSPGATGAPAFSAAVVRQLENDGYLGGTLKKKRRKYGDMWNFEDANDLR
jgi:L-2-hydroxyglutarate oxidase